MNKQFIVLLAVCLFSAHAFVKRDTAKEQDLSAKLNEMTEQLTKLGADLSKKIAEVVDPDVLKKNFNDFIDNANKTIHDFKLPTDPKPAAQ